MLIDSLEKKAITLLCTEYDGSVLLDAAKNMLRCYRCHQIDLQKLLNLSDDEFMHDMRVIIEYFKPTTGKLENPHQLYCAKKHSQISNDKKCHQKN